MSFEIISIGPADDFIGTRTLIRYYADTLQPGPREFVQIEFANFPMHFAAPEGALLMARNGEGKPAGCVAFRKTIKHDTCEMKPLFVRVDARGLGLGRAPISMLEKSAVDAGYGRMKLGTFSNMTIAHHLYLAAGFRPIPSGESGKMDGLIWFEKELSPPTKVLAVEPDPK